MERTYRAFGLTLGSELALPGLPICDDEPTVRIRRGTVPPWHGELTIQYGERFRIHGQKCSITFKGLPFSGLVTDGNLIQVEASPAQDEASSLHVLGSCTGALLFQRGLVPLHGNTVATSTGAAMVVGRIGTGKSTTTMALIRRGHRLMADDISAVSFATPEPEVIPGFPRLKLWKNTMEQFSLDHRQFHPVRAGLDKYHFPVEGSFCATPRRLTSIYILHPGDSPEVRVRTLTGVDKLDALRPHLYKIRFRDAVRNWTPLLGKMCRLADGVRVNIVERPRHGLSIEAVADAIERDLSGSR